MNDIETLILEHAGVKGMKWGVRNEEDASGSSAAKPKVDKAAATKAKREVNAKKYDDRAKDYQKQIDAVDAKLLTTKYGRYRLNNEKRELTELKKTAEKDAALKREGKLSTGQKKTAIGASVAVGILAAYGTHQLVQSGESNRLLTKGKNLLDKEGVAPWNLKPVLANPDLTPNQIMSLVVKPINPDYGGIGTKMNCRRATFAYELRRRGFDVQATKTTNAFGQNTAGLLNAISPDADMIGTRTTSVVKRYNKESVSDVKTPFIKLFEAAQYGMGKNDIAPGNDGYYGTGIFKALTKEPDGARGELGVTWAMGGGHSVSWEKIKGKVHVFDNQTGKMFDSGDLLEGEWAGGIGTAAYTRLDNIPLNHDYLMRWVKDA